MNCKEAQQLILSRLEGSLSNNEQKSLDNHLEHCDACRKIEIELNSLIKKIDIYEEKEPDEQLEVSFIEMLNDEKAKLEKPAITFNNKQKQLLTTSLKIAATLLLIACSYFYGLHNSYQLQEEEKVVMNEEQAISLLESSSASKRIKAVISSKELVQTNDRIMLAFVNIMNQDEHINVRIAATVALSNYTDNKLVIDALINRLRIEKNPNMQLELIQILIDIQDDRILPLIKKIKEDGETSNFIKEQIKEQLSLEI